MVVTYYGSPVSEGVNLDVKAGVLVGFPHTRRKVEGAVAEETYTQRAGVRWLQIRGVVHSGEPRGLCRREGDQTLVASLFAPLLKRGA